MSQPPASIPSDKLSSIILTIRGQRVILDTDLAEIYGVETRVLNQAVKRNRQRFPDEFVFQLTPDEAADVHRLRSQPVILKAARGLHRKYRAYVFTEHGSLMAATVLNTYQAVKMSLYIIRAFVKMREEQAANAAILKRLAEIDKTLIAHDAALRDIFQKLRPLLAPPAEPPRREMGFHIKEDGVPYRVKRKPARALITFV